MDADAKKTTLRMIPYGLYVLVTEGEPPGTGTINWVSQMSFQPPLVALGVKKDTRNFANIKAGRPMALSFLKSGQGDIAFAFFGDAKDEGGAFVSKDKRYGYERTGSGARVLLDAPAWADLKCVSTVETGDHAVVVAEVTDVGLREPKPDVLTLKELGLNYGG
jgi:flavin reductase (DIM6/NTAB) family NADH-FMN oxidoreductase RutF